MASGAAAAPAVQTVVLRVSIHCHGCKKKVRKVLRSIEGVQNVTVDAAQHKVTVTGTVDTNTLVQRLHKSGKKGVPWQYCHPSANKTEPEPAPEALPAPPTQPAGDGGKDVAAADKKPEEAVKEPQAESSEKKKAEQEAEKKPEAESKEEKVEAKDGGDSEAAEPKAKGAEPAKEEANEAVAAASKEEVEAKKNDKPKDAGKAEPVAVTERSLSAPLPPAPKHAYDYEDQYRHPYYPPPQPVLSYHAAQASASVSYFAPQPQHAYSMQQPQPQRAYSMQHPQPQPMQQWSPSYLYLPYPHAAPEPYHQDYYSPPGMHASPPQMQDSYRIFDDENPNSCSVM